jgi:tetratricopeptide (TPR) repeat protein
MLARSVISAGLLALSLASTAAAVDVITFLDSKKQPIRGTISSTSKDAVSIQERGEIVRVPVNEIRAVIYENEPNELRDAREAIRQEGNPARAISNLGTVDLTTIQRAELKTEIQYFTLLARANLAMAGGKENIKTIGGDLIKFLSANPNTYHFYEATEMVGQLLRANQNYAQAIEYFNKLAASPTHKVNANLAIGWTNLDQNQPDAASKAFEAAEKGAGSGPAADELRRMAQLGKAACLGEAGKSEEALKMVNDIIAKADPEERALHARAYNVMGGVHAKASQLDKSKKAAGEDRHANEAVLAYLRVDILYPQNGLEHAEALGHLATLWDKVGHPQRATDVRARLQSQYPSSRWASR